jgi:WD40 repeat protein
MSRDLHIRRLPDVASSVADVVIAPDGRLYAVGFGTTMVVAEWSTGSVIQTYDVGATVEALAFSPDGARVAGACSNGEIQLVALQGSSAKSVMSSDNGGYRELAWSPNGSLLAAGHYEPLVTVFDLSGAGDPVTLDPEIFSDEGRTAVAFAPDSATLLSTAFNVVVRWTVSGWKRKKLALKEHAFFVDTAFSPDGECIAALAETEGRMKLHVWGAAGAGRGRTVELSGFAPRLAWSADNGLVATIVRGTPGLSLWDSNSLEPGAITVETVDMDLSALAAHPRQTAFIAGSEQGQLLIWEEQVSVS